MYYCLRATKQTNTQSSSYLMDQHRQKYFIAAKRSEESRLNGRRNSFEGKRCEVYVHICEQNKAEAAKQRSHLPQAAETLCQETSEKSKRKARVFKKLAPYVEKHVFDGLQREICDNLWVEAASRVYGTESEVITQS